MQVGTVGDMDNGDDFLWSVVKPVVQPIATAALDATVRYVRRRLSNRVGSTTSHMATTAPNAATEDAPKRCAG